MPRCFKDRECPNCKECVPDNEWAAYRRHEDCYVGPAILPGMILPGTVTGSRKAGRRPSKKSLPAKGGL